MGAGIGGISLGGVPPAAGYVLNGTSMGDNSTSNDPIALLQSIDISLKKLVGRLVPQTLMQQVLLDGLAPGAYINPTNIFAPTFNAIIAYVTAGEIGIYKGSAFGTPFMTFPASAGPIYIPFSPQDTQQVTIANDASSAVNAAGFLYLVSY
jgi:hypothetical protein